MKILRMKAVSLCIGIRRMNICYARVIDGEYNLEKYSHPINSFKKFRIIDDNIEINNNTYKIETSETFTSLKNKVKSLNSYVEENIVLGFMELDLKEESIEFYKDNIDKNIWFDDFPGEYEYLLGLIYMSKNANLSQEYFNKALEKGFTPYVTENLI